MLLHLFLQRRYSEVISGHVSGLPTLLYSEALLRPSGQASLDPRAPAVSAYGAKHQGHWRSHPQYINGLDQDQCLVSSAVTIHEILIDIRARPQESDGRCPIRSTSNLAFNGLRMATYLDLAKGHHENSLHRLMSNARVGAVAWHYTSSLKQPHATMHHGLCGSNKLLYKRWALSMGANFDPPQLRNFWPIVLKLKFKKHVRSATEHVKMTYNRRNSAALWDIFTEFCVEIDTGRPRLPLTSTFYAYSSRARS